MDMAVATELHVLDCGSMSCDLRRAPDGFYA
jgi:hypothetical protein